MPPRRRASRSARRSPPSSPATPSATSRRSAWSPASPPRSSSPGIAWPRASRSPRWPSTTCSTRRRSSRWWRSASWSLLVDRSAVARSGAKAPSSRCVAGVVGVVDHAAAAARHVARGKRRAAAVARDAGRTAAIGAGVLDRAAGTAAAGLPARPVVSRAGGARGVPHAALAARRSQSDARAGDRVRGAQPRRDRRLQVRAVPGRRRRSAVRRAGAGAGGQPGRGRDARRRAKGAGIWSGPASAWLLIAAHPAHAEPATDRRENAPAHRT